MLRRPLACAAAGVLAVIVGACAADDGADDAALHLVAAFYPLEFVADRVGGEHIALSPLAPPGVEAHELELTPSQVADVSQADLVVFLTDFQPAVDDAVAEHAADRGFDVAAAVPLLEAAPDGGHEDGHEGEEKDGHEGEEEDGHGHEDEGGEDGHGGEDDGHVHGSEDPHVWLDPDRLATIADELAARLSELDAEHADDYAANAAALRGELETLDAEFTDGLADCQRREIVVSHAAFGYLADRYDLRQVAVSGLTPEEEPSPQRLAEVIHEAEEHGATTIFFEVLVSPAVAEVIATDVGAETAVLDPVEGLAADSDEDYLSLMRANLAALRDALGCT